MPPEGRPGDPQGRGLRLATYNVAWFTGLFGRDGRLLEDGEPALRRGVTRGVQLRALARVFAALDADAVMVIEAPDTSETRAGAAALERFADWAGLRARRALIGFANETRQEIALLYDPDRITARHAPGEAPDAPRFDREFALDLDQDGLPEPVVWSKPPLEVALTVDGADPLHLIGVHAKSKAPHGAKGADAIRRLSIANRRKQLAQCLWLRRRIDAHLAARDAAPLAVMGDFNDGPGLDEYEQLFGRSGVEIVRGAAGQVQLRDPHAEAGPGADLSSARFYRPGGDWLEAMLDYLMLGPDLAARGPRWRIWHPLRDERIAGDAALAQALLDASDHFPVTCDLAPLSQAAAPAPYQVE